MFGLGNPELGVLMLALFVVFIMFGFPIAFTLMALGVFFGYFAMGDLVFQLLVQRSFSVMTNDVLISIPLFVFMATSSSARTSSTGCSARCNSRPGRCRPRSHSPPSLLARSLRPRRASWAPASR